MLLSLLTPVLKCQWHISRVQAASLSTTVFMGNTWILLNPIFDRKLQLYDDRSFDHFKTVN